MAALLNKRAWWLLAALALLTGTVWRASHLESRPLHADEAVQAWLTHQLINGESYRYDPVDRHGPTLYYAAAWLHRLRSEPGAEFDDLSARTIPFLAGIATLALIGFGAGFIGLPRAVGAGAALLLSVETLSTLYHTYFVQEALLALFVWGFLFLLLASSQREAGTRFTPGLCLGLGLLAGLAQATKEITPLYLTFAVAAWWITQARDQRTILPQGRSLALLLCGFLIPVMLFYTSFGQNNAGLGDALRHYGLQAERMADSPHSYPWWWHLRTLGLAPSGTLNPGQFLFTSIGLVGVGLALRPGTSAAHRSIAVFTVGLLVFHSVVAYKTPWLLLTPTIGLALLGAQALAMAANTFRWAPLVALAAVVFIVAQNQSVGRLMLQRYPADARNPFVYEQTPRPFMRLPQRIAKLSATQDDPLRIAIISAEHAWPLPWYLRNEPQVGYFDTPPETLADWDMVVWDSQIDTPEDSVLAERMTEYYGLRPNGILTGYIRRDLWERQFATP